MKKSKYEINHIAFITGFPKQLAARIEDMEITLEGNWKAKLKMKVDTSGWRMVVGTTKALT